MTSPAHHEATKAAMREAGCQYRDFDTWGNVTDWARPGRCDRHRAWNDDRDVCTVVDAAARIAYDLGRRDALSAAADLLQSKAYDAETSKKITVSMALLEANGVIRSLASTPTEETDNG